MKYQTYRSVSICDPSEHRKDGRADVSFRYESFDGGYACYVTASSPEGFHANEAVAFSPDEKDTADFLAIENHSPFWCRPFWGDSLSALPKRTQELMIRDGDRYDCLLPVVSDTYKTLIRGTEGGFELYLSSNTSGLTEIRDQLSYICMTGSDPMRLFDDVAATAAKLLGNGLKLRNERKVAPLFEYFGWCSWDALQIRINHEDMLKKAREFREKGVPVGFAIYDDMWGDAPLLEFVPEDDSFRSMVRTMHASMLRSFEGAPKRFPKGMKAAIDDLKKEGIPYVGVWFPTTGYWSGLQPGGEIAEKLRDSLVVSEEKRQLIVAPEKEKAEAYFDELCGRVKSWGGDFVKIDNQGYHSRYQNIAPIGQSARVIQTAIDETTEKYFDGALINCMGMPSECMFNRRDSAISRCSDDFMPESRAWFAKNILQCSYNGLLQGRFYVNDWDMWWTDDEQAKKNSLCRAISGGPIYVSDKLDRTNPDIIRPLVLSDGHILRCDESATPTADCLLKNPTKEERIFKIRNRSGESALAAVFNINEENRPVSGTLTAKELGLKNGTYLAFEYFSQTCTECTADTPIEITLDSNDDFRLYTLVPKHERFTVLGRTDLFIGVKAVSEVNGTHVELLEGGDVTLFSDSPVTVLVNGETLPVTRDGKLTRFHLPASVTAFDVRG